MEAELKTGIAHKKSVYSLNVTTIDWGSSFWH